MFFSRDISELVRWCLTPANKPAKNRAFRGFRPAMAGPLRAPTIPCAAADQSKVKGIAVQVPCVKDPGGNLPRQMPSAIARVQLGRRDFAGAKSCDMPPNNGGRVSRYFIISSIAI
jgi:hypothetical protein